MICLVYLVKSLPGRTRDLSMDIFKVLQTSVLTVYCTSVFHQCSVCGLNLKLSRRERKARRLYDIFKVSSFFIETYLSLSLSLSLLNRKQSNQSVANFSLSFAITLLSGGLITDLTPFVCLPDNLLELNTEQTFYISRTTLKSTTFLYHITFT